MQKEKWAGHLKEKDLEGHAEHPRVHLYVKDIVGVGVGFYFGVNWGREGGTVELGANTFLTVSEKGGLMWAWPEEKGRLVKVNSGSRMFVESHVSGEEM